MVDGKTDRGLPREPGKAQELAKDWDMVSRKVEEGVGLTDPKARALWGVVGDIVKAMETSQEIGERARKAIDFSSQEEGDVGEAGAVKPEGAVKEGEYGFQDPTRPSWDGT